MIKKIWKKNTAQETPVNNRISGMEQAKRRIRRQAVLVVSTILLTVVSLFAMTSAWYTNVVQTNGLTFEAESWGFEGEITVASEAILAAPGDEGIIDLTVQNNSDSVSAISVNVSKSAMTEEMQQRLYFYVDTRMNRKDEVMERVYLNRFEGYTYNAFQDSELTLTEAFSNAPVIKWEWVYDVLGYYVIGQPYTVNADTDVPRMHIEEYLRPIIYDFDEATTLINTEGESITVELSTVNGVHTPMEFLIELSQTDGYEGALPEDAQPVFGQYYAIDVEENGYGVYAYLCNYSEIQEATGYDTDLGELAYCLANDIALTEKQEALREQMNNLQQTATLTLSAQKSDAVEVPVSTAASLQDTISLGMADVISLNSNITLAQGTTLTIPAGSRVMVDLNGHTLTSQTGTAVEAQPGSSLTLTNGTLTLDQSQVSEPATTYGVRSVGAEVVMNQLTINNYHYGIYVGDSTAGNELDSRVHIMNSTITAQDYAAFIAGNGLVSEQKSRLIIEDSILSGYSIAVSGNGDASGNGRWGTDIQILNSKIFGLCREEGEDSIYGLGIYQPQKNSSLIVRDSHVEGCNGITLKGGSAVIDHSTIVGKGSYQAPSFEGSGSTDTGDAVYLETNYGYEMQLRISGNSDLTSEHRGDLANGQEGTRSLRVFQPDAANVLVEIESGSFDEAQPAGYLAEGSVQEPIEVEAGADSEDVSRTRYQVTGQEAQSNEATEAE